VGFLERSVRSVVELAVATPYGSDRPEA